MVGAYIPSSDNWPSHIYLPFSLFCPKSILFLFIRSSVRCSMRRSLSSISFSSSEHFCIYSSYAFFSSSYVMIKCSFPRYQAICGTFIIPQNAFSFKEKSISQLRNIFHIYVHICCSKLSRYPHRLQFF